MANKLISQLTGAGANLQDIDVIEGQKSGTSVTLKYTGAQMRAVEKAEREAQDDQIELSVGLETDGTFVAPADSWGLRSVDFTAGCVDRGGATGALDENIVNALRLLDAKVYEAGNGSLVVVVLGLNSDTTLTNIVPAGYMLEYVIFDEKSGQEPILDLGTTAGGNQVFLNQALQTSDLTTIVLSRVFSLGSATTLYLNDDDASSTWDGATVDAYFILKPITAGGAVAGVSGTITMGYYVGAYGFSIPPLEAEIDAVLGAATGYTAGTIFLVNDTLGMIYFMVSDGTNWLAIS